MLRNVKTVKGEDLSTVSIECEESDKNSLHPEDSNRFIFLDIA